MVISQAMAAVCLKYVQYLKAKEGVTELGLARPGYLGKCQGEMGGTEVSWWWWV